MNWGHHMSSNTDSKQSMDFLIRVGLVFLLLIWCYEIIKPFIIPLIWAGIIAIAIYPVFLKFSHWTKQRHRLSSLLIISILLSLLILPMFMLTSSSVEMVKFLASYLKAGNYDLASIKPMIGQIPWVGSWLQDFIASKDLEEILKNISPLLQTSAEKLLSFTAGISLMIFQSVIAVLVAGFFLLQAQTSKDWSQRLAKKITNDEGNALNQLVVQTISNVAQGVLGVALLQAFIAGAGMMMADVPGAGFWALMVLIVATIQLPPLLILLPVALYVFSVSSSFVAISFLVLSIVISVVDAPIRAILMSRGSKTPMLVIMLGAIGGMLAFGIVGLFVGAVVLAVGYELFKSWVNDQNTSLS